jgi:hypothetical protein
VTYYEQNSNVTNLQAPTHNTYECDNILKQKHQQIRDTVSPQQEYDMKPDYQAGRSAAKVHRKKKTALKRL